jgi:hypothetical protein
MLRTYPIPPDGGKRMEAIGNGKVGLKAAINDSAPSKNSAKREKRNQVRRQIRLALKMREKLDRYVLARDEKGFLTDLIREAENLKKANFGKRFLTAVGFIYENKAEQYLSEQLGEYFSSAGWKETHAATARKVGMAKNLANTAFAIRTITEKAGTLDERDTPDDDKPKKKKVGGKGGSSPAKSKNGSSSSSSSGATRDPAAASPTKKGSGGEGEKNDAEDDKNSFDGKSDDDADDDDDDNDDDSPVASDPASPASPKRKSGGEGADDAEGNASPSKISPEKQKEREEKAKKKAEKEAKKKAKKEEKRAQKRGDAIKAMEDTLPVFLEMVWQLNAADIEQTVSQVCKMFLYDVSIPWIIRMRRAWALQRMGRIFQDVAEVDTVDTINTDDAKSKFEKAFIATIQKKSEKEQ